jgi:hypothetical protein
LWTRVRFSIVRTLQETTLADLVLGPALADHTALSAPALPLLDAEPRPLIGGA